uniref:Protein timeless homolog isoform X3 n=1 Tax=Cicer arietinum TaxID=3827 RepID=A0A3Q7X8B0_CICAR|nr:protein timeless homolog isoform X3 [Cicer arietinum]
MDTDGLSLICSGLGAIEEDDQDNRIGYLKGEHCLDNLKDLLRFLRRDDPQTRDVFKQVCKWNIVSKDLIPIIEHYHEDRSLLLNAVKVLVFLTMPIEPGSTDIPQQLEYLWDLKSAVTTSDVAMVIVSILERPLENLELGAFTEDDWKLVQLVLTLFRNILAVNEIPLHQKSAGYASHYLSLRDKFLELLFRENVMDIILVLSQNVGSSNVYLRQDNLLLLEIFHYIFEGQEPELIVRGHLNGSKVDEDSQASLDSLQSIMEEEKKKKIISRLGNISRHSQFSGTFARVTMDGSKAVFKGNPSSSRNMHLKSQNVTRGPAKKIAWDHPRLPSTKDKILELLHGFVNQFLSGGYNVLMQSIREDIVKEHPAVQKSDIVVFFQVAEFVTSFQFYKYSALKTKEGRDGEFETFHDADASDISGKVCGPIEASLNESMFQLVISKWRNAYDGLKETKDYKFLSAAGSLLKNMIRMLDLVLKLLPDDSKEPQTARILLYKLFYDQTEEGMTQLLLNLIKTFDTHKQCKSDLADLVEIICKVVKLMDYLQSRGTLRVSKKSRKLKKKNSNGTESGNKPTGDHSCIKKVGISVDNQLAENQSPHSLPNANSTEQEDVVVDHNQGHENLEKDVNSQVCLESIKNTHLDDNGHENVEEDVNSQGGLESMKKTKLDDNEYENVEEDVNSRVGLEPTENINPEHLNEDMLDDTGDFSEDEQLNEISEVDFNVSTLVSAFANHSIIQKLCWLLKFYKSNSLAINHYIISMLRRISDELELHPMLYQLSLLTTFYDILVEQKSCPCKEYANIVDFLNSLVRKMLKKMKKQPLLFVEVLFWKTRRECHYINAEYMLGELGHLKKESKNWNDTQGDGEIGSSPMKPWTRRSIADALGDDEADVVISPDSRYENYGEKLDDVEGFASTSGSKSGRDDNDGEQLLEDESRKAPRRKKKLILDAELETQIKELYEKFKDDRNCSGRIAEVLDRDGKISPAQISNKLKKLGLTTASRKKKGGADETFPTSPNQLEGGLGEVENHKSVNLEGSLLVQHQQKRRRVSAFNEDQETLIKVLYEQFKDHRRCSYMIANALDVDGKFTPAQVSRKLKQLGLCVPQKSFRGKTHQKSEDLMNRMDESDDETLISLKDRKNVKKRKESSEQLHEQTGKDKLSNDDSDDEILGSIIKKKVKNRKESSEQLHEQTGEDKLSNDDSDDEILGSILKKKVKNRKESSEQLHEQTGEDKLSNDDFDDEILGSILKKKVKKRKESSEQLHEQTGEDKFSNDDSDDEIFSILKKKKNRSVSSEHLHELTNEEEMSRDDSEDEMLRSALNENQVGFMNSHQVEHKQVDPDLEDSEDEVAINVLPENAVSRRKLRMVIDLEDDD